MNKLIKRGELWLADFGESDKLTNKQLGVRPCIILQNDIGNIHSPTTMVVPLSSNLKKAKLPTHVVLKNLDGIIKPSYSMSEQIQIIDKTDLIRKLSVITKETMQRINYATLLQLGLLEMVAVNVV